MEVCNWLVVRSYRSASERSFISYTPRVLPGPLAMGPCECEAPCLTVVDKFLSSSKVLELQG